MTQFSYAIVTPSFAPDFFRCQVLCESIEQFVDPSVLHYVIVDERDLALFQKLKSPRTHFLTVESLLPWWIKRLPFARRWWLSLKSFPIRNWILQQIVKISLAQYVKEDVLLFVDSDVAFVKKFPLTIFEQGDKVRLFRILGGGNIPSHYKWHRTAGKLLGIPSQDYYGARYIGNVISWRRDNVLKLYERIESSRNQNWLTLLCRQWHLSEYILYGVFIDKVLKEQSGHFEDSQNLCLEHWEEREMTDQEIEEFLSKLTPNHIAVMVSAKSRIDNDRYRRIMAKAQQYAKELETGKEIEHV